MSDAEEYKLVVNELLSTHCLAPHSDTVSLNCSSLFVATQEAIRVCMLVFALYLGNSASGFSSTDARDFLFFGHTLRHIRKKQEHNLLSVVSSRGTVVRRFLEIDEKRLLPLSCLSVRPSVRMEQIGLPPGGFS